MLEDVVDDGFGISARRFDPDLVMVIIEGDLDLHTVPQATAFLAQIAAEGPHRLVLDLSGLTFLDSSGIGMLIAAQSDAQSISGRLHLLGITGHPPVERPLTLVGLLHRFDVASDLDTMLRTLGTPEPLADGRQHPLPPAATTL